MEDKENRGSSIFYISLEDELLKIFGTHKSKCRNIKKEIDIAQKQAENRKYSRRMLMLKYDNVIDMQRNIIYKERRSILTRENIKEDILKIIYSLCEKTTDDYYSKRTLNEIEAVLIKRFKMNNYSNLDKKLFLERLKSLTMAQYEKNEQIIGIKEMRILERGTMLKAIDEKWVKYLEEIEDLKNRNNAASLCRNRSTNQI